MSGYLYPDVVEPEPTTPDPGAPVNRRAVGWAAVIIGLVAIAGVLAVLVLTRPPATAPAPAPTRSTTPTPTAPPNAFPHTTVYGLPRGFPRWPRSATSTATGCSSPPPARTGPSSSPTPPAPGGSPVKALGRIGGTLLALALFMAVVIGFQTPTGRAVWDGLWQATAAVLAWIRPTLVIGGVGGALAVLWLLGTPLVRVASVDDLGRRLSRRPGGPAAGSDHVAEGVAHVLPDDDAAGLVAGVVEDLARPAPRGASRSSAGTIAHIARWPVLIEKAFQPSTSPHGTSTRRVTVRTAGRPGVAQQRLHAGITGERRVGADRPSGRASPAAATGRNRSLTAVHTGCSSPKVVRPIRPPGASSATQRASAAAGSGRKNSTSDEAMRS